MLRLTVYGIQSSFNAFWNVLLDLLEDVLDLFEHGRNNVSATLPARSLLLYV